MQKPITEPSGTLSMRTSRSLAFALVAIAIGCHDAGTAPQSTTTSFDARHALARIDPIAAVLDQPIIASFEAALSFYESFFRSGGATAVSLAPQRGAFDLRLTRSLAGVARITAMHNPDAGKGKTFVYDLSAGSYVVDATATGAPATGVRFVLYIWDGPNGRPALPLTRLGYVDIAPVEATIGSTELVIIRDSPFLPIADFVVAHAAANGVSTFGIQGSATDGFTEDMINLDGFESGGIGLHHLVYNTTLASSPPNTSAYEQLTYDEATASQTGKLELSYEGHTFTDESAGAGTEIKFDGGLYARVLFPRTIDDATQYLKPDGTPLSQQEVADLNALLDRVVVADFFWISLAWP